MLGFSLMMLFLSVCSHHSFAQNGGLPQTKNSLVLQKKSIIKIDNVNKIENPGLIVLVKDLNVEGEAYVSVNGNLYDLPYVPGGLTGKVVIPIKPGHLKNGDNEILFYKSNTSDGYSVLDSRIETVKEKETSIVGITYYQLSQGVPESLKAFDFVMNYKGGNERKETEIPSWTKSGKVRHLRFDNDPIFLASCYWWLYGENRDVMENIYTKYSDRVIEICKQGYINSVLVRWSTGLSLPFEEEWRKQCTEAIKKFHKNGIKVGVYIAISEIFWQEMFKNEPASVNWVWKDEFGKPSELSWNPLLYLADIRNDDFRQYILKRTELAIDADADELYYDIPSGEIGDMITLFSQIRELINKKGKNLSIYGNFAGRVLLDELCDITKSESFQEPGVWNGKWVHNAAQLRFFYASGGGLKNLEAKYGNGGINVKGPGGEFIAGGGKVKGMTIGWQRPIAEAVTFQAHFSIAENNNIFETKLILKDSLASAIWSGVGRYNKFLEENEEYYTDLTTVNKIGIVSPPYWRWESEFFASLSEMNVLYDVLLLPKINNNELEKYLAKYKVIVIPNIPWLDEEQYQVIANYKKQGGKIYTIGSSENLQKLSTIYSPPAFCKDLKNKIIRQEFLQNLQKLSGLPVISLDNSEYVISNAVRKKNTDKIIFHFLNYSNPLEDVHVKINLEGIIKGIDIKSIRLLSPDFVPQEVKRLSIHGKRIEFDIPKLDIYSIVVVN